MCAPSGTERVEVGAPIVVVEFTCSLEPFPMSEAVPPALASFGLFFFSSLALDGLLCSQFRYRGLAEYLRVLVPFWFFLGFDGSGSSLDMRSCMSSCISSMLLRMSP
jgi:hypothetical protein